MGHGRGLRPKLRGQGSTGNYRLVFKSHPPATGRRCERRYRQDCPFRQIAEALQDPRDMSAPPHKPSALLAKAERKLLKQRCTDTRWPLCLSRPLRLAEPQA